MLVVVNGFQLLQEGVLVALEEVCEVRQQALYQLLLELGAFL
jgi:hypothetical protein